MGVAPVGIGRPMQTFLAIASLVLASMARADLSVADIMEQMQMRRFL